MQAATQNLIRFWERAADVMDKDTFHGGSANPDIQPYSFGWRNGAEV